jgi:hypothetical protein
VADPVPQPSPVPLPWWIVPSLAYLIVIIFAGALAASCFFGNDTLRTQMFSTAVVLATAAVSFYFGSSSGSEKKSDLIALDSANKSSSLASSTPAIAAPPVQLLATQATNQDIANAAAAAEALRIKTAAP